MISKELSEAAVELNAILEHTSTEVIKRIPQKFINFFRENASSTYKFEYDINKTLEEQNLKSKTKGLIALIYKDYLCKEQEKQDYLTNMSKTLKEMEIEKKEKYNPDNIFINRKHNINIDKVETKEKNNLPIKIEKKNMFAKILLFIKNIFNKK